MSVFAYLLPICYSEYLQYKLSMRVLFLFNIWDGGPVTPHHSAEERAACSRAAGHSESHLVSNDQYHKTHYFTERQRVLKLL